MSKNHEPLFFTSTLGQCGCEAGVDAFSCVSIDGYHSDCKNKSGEVVARVWITKHGDIVVDWHNNGCRMNTIALALIEDSKRILREEYQEKCHEKTILQDKFYHNKIRESKLVSFENTFSEFGCEVEEDAFGCITIDGYPEDEDQPGEVVARVWITKHGDIIVDWHDNGYRENDWVLELIEDSKCILREEYQEKWHEKTIFVDKSRLDKIRKYLEVEPKDASECLGEDEIITETVIFDTNNCIEMDIKCCGVQFHEGESNKAWTEAVLFHYGTQIACTEPADTFEGTWKLEGEDGHIYVVNVVAKED